MSFIIANSQARSSVFRCPRRGLLQPPGTFIPNSSVQPEFEGGKRYNYLLESENLNKRLNKGIQKHQDKLKRTRQKTKSTFHDAEEVIREKVAKEKSKDKARIKKTKRIRSTDGPMFVQNVDGENETTPKGNSTSESVPYTSNDDAVDYEQMQDSLSDRKKNSRTSGNRN